MSKIEVDTNWLPLLLNELRLPAIARLWPEFGTEMRNVCRDKQYAHVELPFGRLGTRTYRLLRLVQNS